MNTDTIAAIATAMANSGIGIIRMSGNAAIEIADKVFRSKSNQSLKDCKSHTIHYGYIMNEDEVVDEVLVMIMKAPNSYTRENTIEINCHGGVLVMQKILETVMKYGARPAEPGEFTKRAFLNGRIDLAQAESVIDIINSKNDFALKSSISQLRGKISDKIANLRKIIIHETAYIESAVDDPEHYTLDGYAEHLNEVILNLQNEFQRLLDTADQGRILQEGIHTVIVGKPNVGKSSVLNVLVGSERAIVTDVAGTTRDILEEQVNLNGIMLNVIDTAGIHETEDIVEKIGVDKAKQYLENADLVLYVLDSSQEMSKEDYKIAEMIRGKNVIILLNKSDLEQKAEREEFDQLSQLSDHIVLISAKEGNGIDDLTKIIYNMFLNGNITFNDELVITNIRHKNALSETMESLHYVEESIQNQMPEDFYSIDLMHAYETLGTIIGESVEDDLADEIFAKFCMGK
ncbi:tRNA modification GTPase MnmE [Eubacterium plexicaudatum ASF492]|uniref:tRNA modification GTPase MnmE n=1 Tax=Eubacterium plexicaudatum ASF492 TaxID=1235802 RepID=N2AYB7_9FIRM|nr:tRNA modification GTPase MnmE [Eubacterium plexicaudatum ASF492]